MLVASALWIYKEPIKEVNTTAKIGDILSALGDVAQVL